MITKLRIGLIGLGNQMKKHHIPYLQNRIKEKGDVEIAWISGYLREHNSIAKPFAQQFGHKCIGEEVWQKDRAKEQIDWNNLLVEKGNEVDCVLISIPNSMHEQAIRQSLNCGINVAVEKPTSITAIECTNLVKIAENKSLVFLTLTQRRYENVYQAVKDIIANDGIGNPLVINYMIAHEYFEQDIWQHSKKMSGGGVLMASGYHGIDTILWLLRHCHNPIKPISVSANWSLDPRKDTFDEDRVETVTSARVLFDNGCIFNIMASFENPKGSLDENYKIYGDKGAIRIMRDRTKKMDSSAAILSYQHVQGKHTQYDTSHWHGKETAPLEDFIEAVCAWKNKKEWNIISPANHSIDTLRIINAAYASTQNNGIPLNLSSQSLAVHHIAIQTSDIDASLHFYIDILGAEMLKRKKFKKRQMAWLQFGNVKIELFSKREFEELNKWSDFYSGPVHVAFLVDDINSFLEKALVKGAQFHPSHPEPFIPPVPGAHKIAYLLGPDGEEIEIRDMNDHA